MTDLEMVAVDPRGDDAQRLLAALTAEIAALYADRGQDGTGGFALADVDVPRGVFVVAYADGEPVGCRHIPSFGPYVAWDDSVCFKKPLTPTSEPLD